LKANRASVWSHATPLARLTVCRHHHLRARLCTCTVCLVVERRERIGADPRFGDVSNPSQVWLKILCWSGSDPLFFCLVGGMRLGMSSNFHSHLWVPHVIGLRFSGSHVSYLSSSSSSPGSGSGRRRVLSLAASTAGARAPPGRAPPTPGEC
jgi:hypothetical protein